MRLISPVRISENGRIHETHETHNIFEMCETVNFPRFSLDFFVKSCYTAALDNNNSAPLQS